MWGQYSDSEDMEGNVFQTYQGENALETWAKMKVEAQIISHQDDWIGNGTNSVALFAKYFTNGWDFIASDHSAHYDGTYEWNIWHPISLEFTVPEGAEIVQIGVTFFQPDDQQDGAVYIDNLTAFQIPRNIGLASSLEHIVHGDTGLVDIHIVGSFPALSSIDLSFSGFQDQLDFVDIVADSTSLMGSLGWLIQHNNTDSLLLTASAGSDDITVEGKLFSLKLAVDDTLPSQLVPVDIVHFLGNTDLNEYQTSSGGVQVLWYPEAGFTADLTTGDYPLDVSFVDSSTQGTYDISDWFWNFGNDSTGSGYNDGTVYERPGEFDVTLVVTDSYGLQDTVLAPGFVQVDTVFGDVDWNAMVQAFDASIVLRYLVDLMDLDSLQMVVGDVSADTSLSPLDASLILQYVVGLIDELPYIPDNQYLATGDLTMADQGADSGMLVEIPIHISNGSNIYGFTGTINYDHTIVAYDTLLLSDYLDGYLLEFNELSPGEIRIAAAGNNPDGETGVFATLVFYVTDAFTEETSVSITDLTWNEGEMIEVAAEMTITYGLGIDGVAIPDVFALHQNYPNPFNPITRINYDLPEDAMVNIMVFDMMGRRVKTLINSKQTAGYWNVRWNGTNTHGESVSAWMYIYTIRAGEFRQVKKMVLLK